mmetsp:Transcript_16928/g.48919  ORF Transcript_16928/g.48919 Transcript_16928/m.48919 type:complete len:141 (+) Transcript_16928:376-798(+)
MEADVDEVRALHRTFTNLNMLQLAAVSGDVCLLEGLVALGAALDYLDFDEGHVEDGEDGTFGLAFLAAPSTNALLLSCSVVVLHAQSPDMHGPGFLTEGMEQMVDGCLLRLITLGADVDRRLPSLHSVGSSVGKFNPAHW